MDRDDMKTLHPTYNYDLQLHAKKKDTVNTETKGCKKELDVYAMDGVNFFGAGYKKDDLKFY